MRSEATHLFDSRSGTCVLWRGLAIVMLCASFLLPSFPVYAAEGDITTVAGIGGGGFNGDGGPATSTLLFLPGGVTVDGSGNLYIADSNNQRIRKVDGATGLISTVAGNGIQGFSGDGGLATIARLNDPSGVAVDGSGNLYIADRSNNRIRKVDVASGLISTVAGYGPSGYNGDSRPATSASLSSPYNVALDGAGNLYIADSINNRIRKVDGVSGFISTVAGYGPPGYNGDNRPATSAGLYAPRGVAVDGVGNLYIADSSNHRIRKVDAASGFISTVAGYGSPGYNGDGIPAINASLYSPVDVVVHGSGNLYIADSNNNRIRKVDVASGLISTVAGYGPPGYNGDNRPATSASLYSPRGVTLDGTGNLYIADMQNNRIRQVEGSQSAPALSIAGETLDASTGSISIPVQFAANGASISALAFSLDYDEACLSLDETDGNGDGIPDAVSGLPAGYVPSVSHDAGDSDGELDISLSDQSDPLDALSDGAIATIAFDVISTCPTTAINFSTDPAASFGDTNGDAVSGTAGGGTLTLDYNSAPTDIGLDSETVGENEPADTVVGILSTTDADAGDTHTYSLVAGDNDSGNASFSIVGSELRTAAAFDFESQSSYSIRVQTDDGNGGTFEKAFNIGVNDVNEAPTGLTLDNQTVDENQPSGAVVGSFFTSGDPDAGDSHTYTLTAGDTAAFAVNGDLLETAAEFNYEDQSSYNVTVRTTDVGGLSYEESLTISVNDVNDAPVAVDDDFDPLTLVAVGPTKLDVLANDTDEDVDALLYIESVSSANAAIIDLVFVDDGLEYTPPADSNGSESFTYIATDSLLSSNAATVNITYVADDLRGDCNSNGGVDAGDFSAIALEFFDTDSSSNWWEIYQQGYAGSPIGCDANASENGAGPSVTVADIICTVLVFFGDDTCTSGALLRTAAAAPATLSIAQVAHEDGDTVDALISLASDGNAIAAAGFTLEYDAAALRFDAADANGDGLPDALAFDLPAGVQAWTQIEDGTIQVAVAGLTLPLPTLEDGAFATATFSVLDGGGSVSLQDASLGDVNGNSVSAIINANSVGTITPKLFLPLVNR